MSQPTPDGTTVFISNISEDVWQFIMSISDRAKRQYEILENSFLSDRDLYSISKIPKAIFITPQPIDAEFYEYQTKLTGRDDLTILVPKKHKGQLCLECIKDKKLFNTLVKAGKETGSLTLLAYSSTPQFYELVDALVEAGVTVHIPDSPVKHDMWTVDYFGSKIGIRQLLTQHLHEDKDLIISEGLITAGIEDICQIAANKYLSENGVVIKTNKGHSGAGVLIFAPDELPQDYDLVVDHLKNILKQDKYWSIFPVVVESYVKPDFSIGGGFPNIECRVHASGEVEILYYCGCRVNDKGVFSGVEIIKGDLLPMKMQNKLKKIGNFLGKMYSIHGYNGYFDVDCIYGADGKLYITESNVRRTGGTYAYEATMWFIKDYFFNDFYSASNSGYPLKTKKKYKFSEVKKILEPVLFNPKTREGIILTTANTLRQQKVAYIVFGKDKPSAIKIEKKMQKLLEELK